MSKHRYIDLTGNRFGRLTVLETTGLVGTARIWKCLCDCGNAKEVRRVNLVSGHVQSCGCLKKERERARGLLKRLPENGAGFNSLLNSYKQGAAKRNLVFSLTDAEFKTLTQQDCYHCGKPPSSLRYGTHKESGAYVYSGVDRLDNTVGYTASNSVSCCSDCNFAKGSKTVEEFYNHAERVYEHRKKQNH